MSRKKFKKSLLAVSLLAFSAISLGALASCQPEEQPGPVDPVENNVLKGVTDFHITNKDEIREEWKAGDGNRMLEFTFTGSNVNVGEALRNGSIEITSTNTDVAMIIGQYISTLKEGYARVMVTVHTENGDLIDTVDFDVQAALVQAEPTKVTIAEALKMDVSKWQQTKPQPIYEITGIVGDWYGKDEVTGSYGVVSEPNAYGNFYLHDEANPEDEILVYGATANTDAMVFNSDGTWSFNNPGDFVDDEGKTPVVKHNRVTIHAILAEYNGTVQLNAVITKVEEVPVINYESVTLTLDKNELKIGEAIGWKATGTPENATDGEPSIVIVEEKDADNDDKTNNDVIEIKGNTIYARGAGTAKVKAVAGSGDNVKESAVYDITVAGDVERTPIATLLDGNHNSGRVYTKGRFIGNFAGDQNYGLLIGEGDNALFIYGASAPSGTKVGDELLVTGYASIRNGAYQLSGADVLKGSEDTSLAEVTTVDLNTSLDTLNGKDASRNATVKGTVSNYKLDNYKNVTFDVAIDADTKVSVKADSRYVDWKILNRLGFVENGDTVSLNGNLTFSYYDNEETEDVDESKTFAPNADTLRLENISFTTAEENPDIIYNKISQLYTVEADEYINFYGEYLGAYRGNQTYGSYIGDGDNAILLYGYVPSKVSVGDKVLVSGKADWHGGMLQVSKDYVYVTKISGTTAEAYPIADPEDMNFTNYSAADLAGVAGKDAGRRVTLNGKVKSISQDSYGAFNIVVTNAAGADVNVYADNRYTNGEDLAYFGFLEVGNEVELTGNVAFDEDADKLATSAETLQVVNLKILNKEDIEVKYSSIKQIYREDIGTYVAFYGKVMSEFKGKQNYGLYVGDGEYAVFIYNASLPQGVKVGDVVTVMGATDVHNGGFQIGTGATIKLAEEGQFEVKDTVKVDLVADFNKVDGKYTGREASFTGVVSEYKQDNYKNVTFKLTYKVDEETSYVVSVKADSRYIPTEELTKLQNNIKDGDTITISGNINFVIEGEGKDELPEDNEGLQITNPRLVAETPAA